MSLVLIVLLIILLGVVLYLLAIMPRMLHKPDKAPHMGVLYAHRGLHNNESEAPENTMAAFKKAVDAGYGIELDVQLTKDKVPVVFHDFTLKRMCGVDGKVEDYTYEELQQFPIAKSEETIPTFQEFLQFVDGKVPLIVELKIEGTNLEVCPLADELLSGYKGVYCIESFNPLGVRWYRKNHPDIFRGQLAESFLKEEEFHGMLYFILQNLLMNFLTKPDFVAFNHHHTRALSRRICRSLYHNVAAAWTIKSQEELDQARKNYDIFIFDSFIPSTMS
ncbi:MAG: glycerophosphodiester phosphodiesterase family protein [Lachnospiraceae bacterium]|nr:glycerophosphodiester phosphodiesterase family protein [Lachnospiraceae bacterium]